MRTAPREHLHGVIDVAPLTRTLAGLVLRPRGDLGLLVLVDQTRPRRDVARRRGLHETGRRCCDVTRHLRAHLQCAAASGFDLGPPLRVGALAQQELQTPRIQVNAAGQLVRTNPVTNQVEILGDARQLLGQAGGQPQGQPQAQPALPANPTLAQGQVLGQTAKAGTEDWNTTFNEANAVPVRVQALEKIRDLSKKTTTGTGSEQVRLLGGVLDLLGIDSKSAANFDELKKNSAILQMGPAGTDMARAIAQMATPGAQIQPEAIRKISDQLIGLERRKSARAKFLEPFKNNADLYQSKAMEFNQVANPIFFQDISDEEYNKYKRDLPEDRRNALKIQVKKMRDLGIE